MKKTIICNIPMKKELDRLVYKSDDKSLPTAVREVIYPICSFLEETLHSDDELKIILLVKEGSHSCSRRNVELFRQELETANKNIGAAVTYVVLETEFKETKAVHEHLMGRIVDELENDSHIIADITYGPKDLPIVIFAALSFAERFLNCSIDDIVYGQVQFVDGHATDAKICDMVSLYCLSSITNMVHSTQPEKARFMLKELLSL